MPSSQMMMTVKPGDAFLCCMMSTISLLWTKNGQTQQCDTAKCTLKNL